MTLEEGHVLVGSWGIHHAAESYYLAAGYRGNPGILHTRGSGPTSDRGNSLQLGRR